MKKSPARAGLFADLSGYRSIIASAFLRRRGGLLARRRHERIEVRLGDAEPENVVLAKLLPRLVHLLELWIAGGALVVNLDRRLMACLHDLARERPQLHACGDEPSQRRRIHRIV